MTPTPTKIFLAPRALLTVGLLCIGALFGSVAPAAAQDDHYPSRPIRLIVGFPPGGGVDAVGRIFADRLSVVLGQPVVVMNHGGAAGGAAAKLVATEPPDGYSVLINSNSMLIFSLMNPDAGLDIERDLRAVVSVAPQAIVIVASPELNDASLSHLVALAHSRVLNYGSPGSGSIPHLAVELLSATVPGLRLQHVPFQGAAPALTAVMANQIDFAAVTLPAAVALVTAGKVKGVVVTGDTRSAALPQIPTAAEAGYPGIAATTWTGFFVPPKTPAAVVDRLEQAILQVAAKPDVKAKLTELGFEPVSTPGAQFRSELSAETKTWNAVLQRTNLIQK